MPKRKKNSPPHIPQARSKILGPAEQRLRIAAGIGLIILAAFVIYLPSLRGGFILDDDILLTTNPLIKASDGLYCFWCTTQPPDYWPVSNTSLWLRGGLWGGDPTRYH